MYFIQDLRLISGHQKLVRFQIGDSSVYRLASSWAAVEKEPRDSPLAVDALFPAALNFEWGPIGAPYSGQFRGHMQAIQMDLAFEPTLLSRVMYRSTAHRSHCKGSVHAL